MIDRRTWLAGFLGLILVPPIAEGQAPADVPRIGLLGGSSPTSAEASRIWSGFFQGLRELGYVEGRNILIEGRYYGDTEEPTTFDLVISRKAVKALGLTVPASLLAVSERIIE